MKSKEKFWTLARISGFLIIGLFGWMCFVAILTVLQSDYAAIAALAPLAFMVIAMFAFLLYLGLVMAITGK